MSNDDDDNITDNDNEIKNNDDEIKNDDDDKIMIDAGYGRIISRAVVGYQFCQLSHS
jgi:hypothetical protein